MGEPIEPCPFCRGRAVALYALVNFNDVEIKCVECHASGPNFDDSMLVDAEMARLENLEAATTHWNTRAVAEKPTFRHFFKEQNGVSIEEAGKGSVAVFLGQMSATLADYVGTFDAPSS